MIIDTHCHIYKSEMEDAEEIIKKAAKNDIRIILNGTNPLSNKEVLELSSKYDNVYAALGYLYSFADEVTDGDILLLDNQLDSDKVVAVGEIGLDYYHTKENRDKQKQLFEKMLNLAEKHDLPVIVHSRKSMQDTFDILKKHDAVGSMHSYQGSVEMAQEFIKLGFYIGIGGTITHKNNKKTKMLVKKIDIGHMLVETDSPYLTPEEKRGERNTSLNLNYITSKMAQELDMGEDEVIEITAQNAKRLFKI
ncbi:MAG: TatD family hydrolase [Methanobrevibacter sp.]|uniref:TatD family hydrolase n=1 Tax=Methanobrevibacter sp. TaxID=66852 RepID=UPI0025E06D78|nr:TatD family hydrolase [Methanobrevibacter sp.]MBQ8016839.1 TatD family hydrolase [Methanobrevibacter sp.]MBR1610558.1 TatD family hydrolase [Methanobrevibacter sp.]